jgi:hypothetical protein
MKTINLKKENEHLHFQLKKISIQKQQVLRRTMYGGKRPRCNGKILGSWNQYSGREFSGFFRIFPARSGGRNDGPGSMMKINNLILKTKHNFESTKVHIENQKLNVEKEQIHFHHQQLYNKIQQVSHENETLRIQTERNINENRELTKKILRLNNS